ncbi:MAG: dCTP deaminase [Bacilli bacterium]|nr:dCTP deaminase [Bacilli bacterium]
MLSGEEIIKQIEEGKIVITPFDKKNIGANSYSLHIADELKVYEEDVLECKKPNSTRTIKIPEEGYVLRPGELYLSRTLEYTETDHFVPILYGKLSLAALGVTIHITAGFGDIGFKGTWTLEICCIKPVRIYPNMKVAQICYFPIVGSNNIKYTGKYLGQVEATASRIFEDEEFY